VPSGAEPLVGHGADWWFFRSGSAPVPVTDVSVVKTKTLTWDGKSWQLTAYGSLNHGICFSMTPTRGVGAAMACAQIEGGPRTSQSKPYAAPGITFLSGGASASPSRAAGGSSPAS
jgi:hypothetical protein